MFTGDYGFFDYKYDIPGYHGQDFGGPAQLFYLALSALLTVLLLRALRGLSRERLRRLVGWTGVFLILLYLGKTAWETYYDLQRSGSFNWGLLPLDTCSLVMPAALLAALGFTLRTSIFGGMFRTFSMLPLFLFLALCILHVVLRPRRKNDPGQDRRPGPMRDGRPV